MSTCQCSMAIGMLGEGCRYCQPQTYIEHLLETLEDARAAPVSGAKAQEPVEYQQWSRYENWDRVDKAVFELGLLSSTPERFRALYAAPVSEAKAQGVRLPPRMWEDPDAESPEFARGHNAALCYVERLNAAPVQRVSVPDGWRELLEKVLLTEKEARQISPSAVAYWNNAVMACCAALAAAPAAPAADAGIVDMYRHLQKVTPYRFKKIQDASITDGGDVMYFHKDRFDAALLADMAALSAGKEKQDEHS